MIKVKMKKESIFIRVKKWWGRVNRSRIEKAVKNDPYC